MQNKGNHKYRLKIWVRITILITFILLMVISATLIHFGRHPLEKEKIYYNYDIDENVTYNVHLKENNFYEEEVLGEGKQYATEIIDYINLDFNYNYHSLTLANTEVKYEINGTIIGEYENVKNGNAELWKKNYVLLNEITDTKENSSLINVQKNLKIDYQKYSKVVDDFKSSFKIPIDAYLDVALKVTYLTKNNDGVVLASNSDTMNVKIPLSKTTIKIDKTYDAYRSLSLSDNPVNPQNKKLIKIGLCINLISVAIFLALSPQVFMSSKSYYEKTLRKILRSYAEIIVETTTPPDTSNLEIIEIKTFDDMVDIEEEKKSPILYYDAVTGEESYFYVIDDGYLYQFILEK